MFECYRVVRQFRWRGWHYGPEGRHITGSVGPETQEFEECDCPHYAGHIFVVEEAHPRKSFMIEQRRVRGDASLRPQQFATDDDWVAATPELSKLTSPPSDKPAPTYTPPQQRPAKANA